MSILDSMGQYGLDAGQGKAAMGYGFDPRQYQLIERAMQNRGMRPNTNMIPEWAQNAPAPQQPQDNTQATIAALAGGQNNAFRPGMQAAQASGDSYNGWNALADILGAYAQQQMK